MSGCDRPHAVPALGVCFPHANRAPASTRSPAVAFRHVARLRIAELHDEATHDPVDAVTVVEIPPGERDDVLDRLRRFTRVGLNLNGPFDGLEDENRSRTGGFLSCALGDERTSERRRIQGRNQRDM